MFGTITKLFGTKSVATLAGRTKKHATLQVEVLEGRDVPSGFYGVPNYYQLGGLVHPAPTTSYVAQNYANQQLNQIMHTVALKQALSVTPQSLMYNGLEAGLANAISQARVKAATTPSILDARPVTASQYHAAASQIQAGAFNLPYILNPSGYTTSLMNLGGYHSLTTMNYNQLANAALADPYLGLVSGNLTTQVTNQYITQHYTNGTTNGVNGVGIMNAVGLGNTGAGANVALAQAVGAFGVSRPAGTGTGSPFVDALLGHL